jgi:NADPH-dependent 2,4-dienoyl-CoA reductase/sulfur reductase-like enzyme
MEAARVAQLRGHEVVLLEATGRLGGQINLAAKAPGREEIAGIAGWVAGEIELLGVDVRYNSYAEADEVLALNPDVVIVATGGVPDTGFLDAGEDLVASVWDVLGGYVDPAGSVLLYDDHGWHQGPSAAVALAHKGVRLEVVTPDRMLAFEVGATNFPTYLRALYRGGATLTPDFELRSVRREGNRLVASLWNEYADDRRACRRSRRGRARDRAGGRALPCAQGRVAQRWGGGCRGTGPWGTR